MAMPAEPRGGRCPIASLLPALIALTALAILVAQAVALLRGWDPGVRETPPTFRSPGPTVVQLERLRQLVSTRVHVADVLVGESRWLEGSWIIQGDALLAVDLSKAEVKDGDEKARTAAIVLPQPAVLSPRSRTTRGPGSGTSSPAAGSRWPARSWATAGPSRSRRCGRPSGSSSGPPARKTTRRRRGRASEGMLAEFYRGSAGRCPSAGSDLPRGDVADAGMPRRHHRCCVHRSDPKP